MFGQSLLSAFGIACTTDTDQLFATNQSVTSIATYQLNASPVTSIPGNNYPGTASNITFAAGKFGNAAVFNGSNSKIIANGKPLNNNTSITISFWARNISSSDWKTLLGEGGDSGNTPGYKIYTSPPSVANSNYLWMARADNSGYVFDTYDGSAANKGGVDMGVAGSTWVHCVFTVSPTQLIVYKNGVNVKSLSISNTSSVAGYYDFQFMYDTKYNRYLQGELDQVRLFDTTLSQAAVTALYNETTTTATSASVDYQLANPNSIAYYKMSDATDQLGNYNGTATNVNFNTEGKFGFAGAFNGSSSRIILGTSQDFSVTKTGEISFSLWIKTTTSGTGYVFSKGNDATVEYEYFLELLQPSGKLNWRAVNNSDLVAAQVTPNTVVTDGNWHHIVGVIVNNTSVTLYIDGVATTSSSWSGTISYYANNCLIGHGDGIPASGAWFEGDIDQIRIYDSALSASDISTLYKEVECEPAAINALDHFNTVLYTGNNTTNVINTVGFEPGLLWVKTRDDNKNHVLVDTVRGISSVLEADTPAAAVTGYTDVTSFDPNGFTLAATSAVYMNPAGIDMVSWNWKAALANLSTNFNGSSSYIELAFASLNVNNNFTWSFWIKFNSFTLYDTPIGFFMNGYTNFIDLVDVNGQLSFYDGQSRLNTPGSTFATGSWYHVAVTKSSTNGRKFYVNGSEVASNSSNSNSGSSSGGRNLLGAYSSSGNPTTALLNVDGDMAQVRIFHSALTASQISDLYAEPAASNNTLNYPAGAGCIAAYPLQTNAVDLSGNYSGASSNVTFGQPGYLTQNTYGTIPSTVAANQEAGFSVVKYTGTGSNATIGHGLGATPQLIIDKVYSAAGYGWTIYAEPTGTGKYLTLNSTATVANDANFCSVVGSSTITSYYTSSSQNHIAYFFTSIAGYSKVGSYTSTYPSTTSVYVGFQPRFVMIKSYNQARNWVIHDSTRTASKQLYPNLPNSEADTGTQLQFTSTGFNVSGGSNDLDGGSSYSYIFLAIA
jgi:hypothetical protein